MKKSSRTYSLFPSLKSLSDKVGDILCCGSTANKYKRLDTKLEMKIMEVKRSSLARNNFRSVNSIILKFPMFREGLKEVKGVFQQCDADSNGTIDHKELKNCFEKLNLQLKEEEIDDLFGYCDMDGTDGIQLNEFIIILCLVYLLLDPSTSSHSNLDFGSPNLKATFDAIIEAFLFFDKNGDGKLNKKDMTNALNDDSQFERSPTHITRTRFKEMDWDRNGQVSFREFLFALIKWVGFGSEDENTVINCSRK
ncbi:putative calcium-binding protein CML22 [Apium graveolens]|uniref:putative calcium-binding protein CML22 n=1 Tax=Apium graveolens TaxID=4045 RepID=UPI003D78DFE1